MVNKRFTGVTLLGVLSVLAACGTARGLPFPGNSAAPAAQPARTTAGAPAGLAAGAGPTAATAPAQSTAQGQAALPPLPPINRMIIKNGTLSIMVDDTEQSISEVGRLVHNEQGTITNQAVRTENGKTFAAMTLSVPADNFEETMAQLRDLRARGSVVVNDSANSQDVTDQFVDLDAQYRNLQATRDAYQSLLGKATSVSDIITLTREIANIQTQMDQIKGRENLLSAKSAVSTIVLNLSPIGTAFSSGTHPLPKPVQAAQDAWQALLIGLQGLAVVLIWLAILIPIPGAVVLGGWLVYRRVTAPRPA